MTTTNEINTKAAVSKFLTTKSVIDKEDKTADSADEIKTILESAALSFLLYPQAALSFVLKAKNTLQQIVSADLSILDFISKAVGDIENPDEPITDISDLIEAQTALVEVDRLGRISNDVKAYDRYNQSINRFLNAKLAKSLKRRRKSELERTGPEAKQDLFKILSVFSPSHSVMISRLGSLLDSVNNFNGVALTKIVSTKTISKVRSSLNKIVQALNKNQISKTATAIELLAGSAALNSISNTRKINDPTIDTGSLPAGRVISISSERTQATATGTSDAVDLGGVSTPWIFGIIVDPDISGGTSYSFTLPATGASGRSYVKTSVGSPTYNIPIGNNVLYVQFDGITPPLNQSTNVRAVSVPTGGSVSISAVLTALNNVSTGLIDGTAIEMAPGTGRILIYGSGSVTGIIIKSQVPGTFDSLGNFVPEILSVHSILGFFDEQTSGDPNIFTTSELVDFLSAFVLTATSSIEETGVVIRSNSLELLSTLSFSGVASNFGFLSSTYRAKPGFLELIENDVAVDPSTLGVFIGSVVSAQDISESSVNDLFSPITELDGTHLLFNSDIILPRISNGSVKIISPLVFSVQTLLNDLSSFNGIFENDSRELQKVLSPLLSKPTLAQINDAIKTIESIRVKVNSLLSTLSNVIVRADRTQFDIVATQITAALEERGLDRAIELLQTGQFSDFFTLTNEDASKSTRFLKATEQVGRNDFARTTAEQNLDDLIPKGTTPDNDVLPGEDLLENQEQL